MRITIRNHSATGKNTKEGGKKIQLSQKGCVLLQVLIPIFNCKYKDLQGGTLCGHVFCKKKNVILNKEHSFFEQGKNV